MIKVTIFNGKPGAKLCQFEESLTNGKPEFKCVPEGPLSPAQAECIARELGEGRISGIVGQFRWYRQAGGG
jgi:hypothetical protein